MIAGIPKPLVPILVPAALLALPDDALAVLALVDPAGGQDNDAVLAELDRIAEVVDLDRLALSVAARLGLTGFVKAIAAPYARSNVTINNLLPEMFETDRLTANMTKMAGAAGRTLEAERQSRRAGVPAARFGRPEEFGAVCAFYCSAHTGYITGQNILLDGGLYPATF